MATLAASRERVSKNIITMNSLAVGSATMINGFTVSRETEGSFHLQQCDEGMFGSARNVAEWVELVKIESNSPRR